MSKAFTLCQLILFCHQINDPNYQKLHIHRRYLNILMLNQQTFYLLNKNGFKLFKLARIFFIKTQKYILSTWTRSFNEILMKVSPLKFKNLLLTKSDDILKHRFKLCCQIIPKFCIIDEFVPWIILPHSTISILGTYRSNNGIN